MGEIQTLATHMLNGLAYGLLLFILAAGLSLIFGMMDVINLSHGSFYLVGGFLGVGLVDDLGSWWLALAVTVGIVAVLGLIAEISLLRPMYNRDHLDQILLTFGLALIIEDASEWIFGTTIQSMSYPSAFSQSVEFLGVVIPSYRLLVIFVGLVLAVALYLLLERTRVGSIIRAGVSDREMVSALGFNITAIFGGVFVGGLALAGLAGFIGTPILGVYSGLDFEILILTLIIVVVGGLGSLTGAFWASLLIGITQILGQAYFPSIAALIIYIVMAIVLLVRPQGLFQRRYA
ncbi:MAG TPA: branched-chain amino acid ABC transporter permease [Rubrobacteraceae bacterium]|jgi:branched-chain amino acid transport system permease protein|nr:branched-chain amino acid ABC transporter permease [Rubrobacteraceae bacterium]